MHAVIELFYERPALGTSNIESYLMLLVVVQIVLKAVLSVLYLVWFAEWGWVWWFNCLRKQWIWAVRLCARGRRRVLSELTPAKLGGHTSALCVNFGSVGTAISILPPVATVNCLVYRNAKRQYVLRCLLFNRFIPYFFYRL